MPYFAFAAHNTTESEDTVLRVRIMNRRSDVATLKMMLGDENLRLMMRKYGWKFSDDAYLDVTRGAESRFLDPKRAPFTMQPLDEKDPCYKALREDRSKWLREIAPHLSPMQHLGRIEPRLFPMLQPRSIQGMEELDGRAALQWSEALAYGQMQQFIIELSFKDLNGVCAVKVEHEARVDDKLTKPIGSFEVLFLPLAQDKAYDPLLGFEAKPDLPPIGKHAPEVTSP